MLLLFVASRKSACAVLIVCTSTQAEDTVAPYILVEVLACVMCAMVDMELTPKSK